MSILIKLYIFATILSLSSAFGASFSTFKLNTNKLNLMSISAKSNSFSTPIYTEIENTLNSEYTSIGEDLITNTLTNHTIGDGVKNYKGFTWNKPFANFSMKIDRTVSPDLFSSKWITRDILTIKVKAQTLISNFENEGLIEIDSDTLAAFAGLEFTRTFEVSTLVENYNKGIRIDLKNLFFAFKKLNATNVLNMQNGEFVKRVDTLSFNIGGVANIPLTTGLSLNTAALAKYSSINLISAASLGDELTIVSQKEKKTKVGLSAALEIDFFNLLKISLLSYELNYELSKSQKISIKLDSLRRDQVLESTTEINEIKRILAGKHNDLGLSRDIASIENRESKNLTSKYELFLFGKEKSKNTESFLISNNNIDKSFYRHTNTSKTYEQTFLSKFLQRILGVSSVKSELTKTISLEYEKQFKETDDVKSTEDFSFNISHNFYAKSLKRKKNRSRATKFIKYWAAFNQDIKGAIENKRILGPIRIKSNLSFKKEALDNFLSTSYKLIKSKISIFCKTKYKSSRCLTRLISRYDNVYNHNMKYTTINMNLFRDFIFMVYNYSYKVEDFGIFFKKENISMNGSINAKTNTGELFNNYFNNGQVKSTGVISSFFNN